ncbi:unnamed protein product, partial [Ectocarpus sp. 12 AP-2014]
MDVCVCVFCPGRFCLGQWLVPAQRNTIGFTMPTAFSQGNHAEAQPLCERSLAIRERMLGPEHPDVAQSLNNRALLLESQGEHNDALPLLERASSIRRKKLGENH